jgi:hypothetical protein
MRRYERGECRSVLIELVTLELFPNNGEEALFKKLTTKREREKLKNWLFFSIPILCYASQTEKFHVSIHSAIRWIIPPVLCHALFQQSSCLFQSVET